MKSPFEKFLNKNVRLVLKSNEVRIGKLVSVEDGWCLLDNGGDQGVFRYDNIKEMSAKRAPRYLYSIRIGRITDFDSTSGMGRIQERGSWQTWDFYGDAVRDALLAGQLSTGRVGQLVKFLQIPDFKQKEDLEAGEVKPVSHHALRAKSALRRLFYELMAMAIFMFRNRRRRMELQEHRGFVCEFNADRSAGLIREEGTDSKWSFVGNDIAERGLFDRLYSGELGMSVSFFGHRRSSPGKVANARSIRPCGVGGRKPVKETGPSFRTTSGRITAYYADRGFGFVKEVQSSQVWFFHMRSLAADSTLQESLERGELNQLVTLSGSPQPKSGCEYTAVTSMHGLQPRQDSVYLEADRAEKSGDLQRAEELYKKCISDPADPSKANAIKGYAYLLNRLDRADEAIALVNGKRDLFDLRTRLGMLSVFYRKAGRYAEAAGVLRQMAFNLGLPKGDDKRISYLLQGAKCFCEAGDFSSARDLLSYLPDGFDRSTPLFAAISRRIGMTPAPEASHGHEFQYPVLAIERLGSCKYTGLPHQRLVAGDLGKADISLVCSLVKDAPVPLPPSVEADYYLTMAKIADDIGSPSAYYLFRHFLSSAVDAAFGVEATPPKANVEDVLCEVVQAFCCVQDKRFHVERLWYVCLWAFCPREGLSSSDMLVKRFDSGCLIRGALGVLAKNSESCDRLFQTMGHIQRHVPKESFAFLENAMRDAGWQNVEERCLENDRYAGVEGALSEVTELEGVDERSLLRIVSALSSDSDLPSSFDREICASFAELVRKSADYAAQQSNFVRCAEIYDQIQYMAKAILDDTHRSILLICSLKPAVQRLMEVLRENYDRHRGIRPELAMELRYDDPEAKSHTLKDGMVTIRLSVRSMTEAAPPVRNLQFAISGDQEDTFRAEYMSPKELADATMDIEFPPFKVPDSECEAGEFSIKILVGYDTVLGEHCRSVRSFAIKLATSESAWTEIEPNPYRPLSSGAHVDDDCMFFGRTQLVADIVGVLRHVGGGQCFVLYGQKRSGKSSVMETVCRRLVHTEEKCIISKISVQSLVDKGSRHSLFSRFASRVSSEVRKAFGEHRFPIPSDFPTVSEVCDNPMDAMERLARMVRDEGLFWVLTVDEFTSIHQEDRDSVSTFMHNWKAMLQAHLFNALIIGQDTMPKLMDEHPNDFCVSHNVRLPYLTRGECGELASKPIELKGKSRYLENSLNEIFDWTLGSPYLVQKFCCRLVDRLNQNKRTYVVDSDVESVARSMYSGADKMPEHEFDSFITAGDADWVDFDKGTLMKVLIAVAKESRITGWAPKECVIGDGDEDEDEQERMSRAVDDLVKRDALERANGKLKVPVKLFAEWLRVNM